jgi:hypothetical protein
LPSAFFTSALLRTFMKIDQAKQVTSKAIEELSPALEADHSEMLKEYLVRIANA